MRTIKALTHRNLASRVAIAALSLLLLCASPSLAQVPLDGSAPQAISANLTVEMDGAPLAAEATHYGSSAPVRIRIPELQIDAQVQKFGWDKRIVDGQKTLVWNDEDIADGMAGHLASSARPGQGDNVVIAGHSNVEGRVFQNLSEAWEDSSSELMEDGVTRHSTSLNGMTINLHDASGRVFSYRVENTYKVQEAGASVAQKKANARFTGITWEPTLTVFTCWPPHSNTHRVIAVARPAS